MNVCLVHVKCDYANPPDRGHVVDNQDSFHHELRTPRSAAIAGIVFSILLAVAVVLLHSGMPSNGNASQWLTDSSRRRAVTIAMELVPFAGIAFLWFIGVIRSRLGASEDKLFATVFLGSGLLFVAMLFTAAAGMDALLRLYDVPGAASVSDVRLAAALTSTLLTTFGIRMAAVFTLVTTSLGLRTKIMPIWLVVFGYATGAVLLFVPPRTIWTSTLLFPVWVFIFSLELLVVAHRSHRQQDPDVDHMLPLA